jgi:hypothetical protein
MVGLGLGGLFYLTARSGELDIPLLIIALVCFAVGMVLRRIFKPVPVDSGRFRMLRRKHDNNDHEDDA